MKRRLLGYAFAPLALGLGLGAGCSREGQATTEQKIHATPNYYAPGEAPPIVLVDRQHWTERLPAWQLLTHLAAGRGMADRIHLVDSVEEVPGLL